MWTNHNHAGCLENKIQLFKHSFFYFFSSYFFYSLRSLEKFAKKSKQKKLDGVNSLRLEVIRCAHETALGYVPQLRSDNTPPKRNFCYTFRGKLDKLYQVIIKYFAKKSQNIFDKVLKTISWNMVVSSLFKGKMNNNTTIQYKCIKKIKYLQYIHIRQAL